MSEILKYLAKMLPVEKVYDDLLHPGLKKAGVALADVFEFGLIILLPLKLTSAKVKLRFKAHLESYEKKLQSISEENSIKVPEQFGLPIVDKLLTLEEGSGLADNFINLLTKASSKDTIKLVHPSFFITLNNMSSDEAKILNVHKASSAIPFIDIYVHSKTEEIPKPEFMGVPGPKSDAQLKQMNEYTFQDRRPIDLRVAWNLTGLEDAIELDFPENIDVYIDNLFRLGIIAFERKLFQLQDEPAYDRLKSFYKTMIDHFEQHIQNNKKEKTKSVLQVHKGYIEFTEYGKEFIKACINV